MVFRTHLYHLYRLKLLFLCAAALTGCDDKELINPGGRAISFSVADTGFPADTDGTRSADSAPRHHSQPLGESGLYLRTTVEPMQPVTRAVPDDFRGFGVFAYMNDALFMNNVEVTKNGENWEYNTMYWPTGTYTMKFFAYAPYKKGFNIPVGGTISYDITESQYDLMAATPKEYNVTPSTTHEKVSFEFEHLLTRVAVKTAYGPAADTKITSITFSNISTSGTYTSDGDNKGWSLVNTSAAPSITPYSQSESEVVFMMLPQDLTNAKITVELESGGNTKELSAPLSATPWNKGESILYTVSSAGLETWNGAVANCYMLEPTEEETIYRIPIKERINRFWGDKDLGNDDAKLIGNDTEWTAEVIWQDYPDQIITFCDASGAIESDTWTSKGGEAFYVKTTKKSDGTYLGGNVLVGIKLATESGYNNYLWSWHLWITDYSPDEAPSTGITDYVQNVTGGAVHRYDGKCWKSDVYKNKYMMDRNLGAIKATSEAALEETCGMYYEFGRKDPLPMMTKIDNTFSKIKSIANVGNAVPLSTSVKNPCTFYYEEEPGKWDENFPNDGVKWRSPLDSGGKKSIFDPSPPGWRVPSREVWEGGSIPITGNVKVEGGGEGKGKGVKIKYGDTVVAFYPFSGIAPPQEKGKLSEVGTTAYCWSQDPLSKLQEGKYVQGFDLRIDIKTLSMPDDDPASRHAHGEPVRCIRDN